MSNFALCLCACVIIASVVVGLMMAVRSLEENQFNRDNLAFDAKIYGGAVGVLLCGALFCNTYMEADLKGVVHLALLYLFIVVTLLAMLVITATLVSHQREHVC